MKPEELLDFVKACSKHWLRPVSMLVAFKVDYRNNGIEVRAYYKGCSYNILIPFVEIEMVGEHAVTGYLNSIDRELRNQAYQKEVSCIFGSSLYTRTETRKVPKIVRVIFNNPATIVFWSDNTKTVVKAENEDFDKEKGLAMAITKKALGNAGNYYNELKRYLGELEEA